MPGTPDTNAPGRAVPPTELPPNTTSPAPGVTNPGVVYRIPAPAAQEPASPAEPVAWPDFALIDANGDGSVNRDEGRALVALAERWTEFDVDQSGAIDSGEYIRARSKRNSTSVLR